jgi:hypothetical protein
MATTLEQTDMYIAEARHFLEMLFDPEDVIEIRCLNEETQQVDERFWWTLSEFDFGNLWKVNERRRHVWFGVNPRQERGGASTQDVSQCRSLCLDMDGVLPTEGLARIRDGGLPTPTITITSGGGSQYFWRLTRPLDREHWSRKQRGIIRSVAGADTSIKDPPRAMRLPGFRNWKAKYAPIFPRARIFYEGCSR